MLSDEVVAKVVDALNGAAIPYMLTGSLASNLYGIPRSTLDADFMIVHAAGVIDKLIEQLGSYAKIDRQMQFETVTMTFKNEATVIGTSFKIEFFHLSDDEFQQERFRRRRPIDAYGRTVFVPSPEDVIVMKSRWARSKDIDDLESVIGVQADSLDWAYIYGWADRFEFRGFLDEIRARVPRI